MKIGISLTTAAAVGTAISAGLLTANAIPGDKGGTAGQIGADVAVCDLPAVYRWGVEDGISAYSVGTTSVNLGDVNLDWYAQSNRHPRIPQNSFKFDRGRLIQIGQSWCKDGFCALQQNQCGSCQPAGGGCPEILGPGCSDPYSSSINGDQSGLAPRSQCNPATGFYVFPPENLPSAAPILGRRLQIDTIELNPNATTDDARFYMDAFYLHIQDYEAGNQLNNGSYRRFNVGDMTSTGYSLNMTGPTNLGLPAIFAWEENSDTVEIETIDLPGDGRIFLAHDVLDNGDGTWTYHYAIYNLTSDDAINGFTIASPAGTAITDRVFHDAPSHSGELYKTYSWAPNIGPGYTGWKTSEYSVDQNANAVRWGTMYNFSLTADAPPTEGTAELELFKSDGVAEITIRVPSGSDNPYDLNGDGLVDGADAGIFFSAWGTEGPQGDFNGDGIVDGADGGLFFSAWG